jgi:hypothetical protein
MAEKDVLYIAQDASNKTIYDRGSRICMDLLADTEGLETGILVQNTDVLRQRDVDLPDWLTGTPSFVDVRAKKVFRGTEAIERLREVVAAAAEDGAARNARTNGGVEGMTAPGQRFVDEFSSATPGAGEVREGKVTESELQAFMAARETAIPTSSDLQT